MRPPKLNSVEPPRYGPVCQVVWEGRCREASPYPDPVALRATRKGGRVVCAGIHMSDIPSFPYRWL